MAPWPPRAPRPALRPEPFGPPDEAGIRELVAQLDAAAQTRLGRTLAVRHVNTGGCNGCELEIRALTGVLYDLERFGLRFVASPRNADVLLVTGPLTRTMREALERTWDATPDPRWVVGVGDCAVDGGVFRGSYAVCDGIGAMLPANLVIRGCPPTPVQILSGLRALLAANARRSSP